MEIQEKIRAIFLGLFLSGCLLASIHGNDIDSDLNSVEENQQLESILGSDIHNALQKARKDDGTLNPSGLIQSFVHDPLPIQDFNVSSSRTFSKIRGQFWNMSVHGLRGLEIHRVKINLAQTNITVEMYLPLVRLEGLYQLGGSITFFSVSGNGNFWMNITHIVIHGSASVNSTEDGKLEVGVVNVNVEVEDIKMHFENLMGGGTLSSITNSLLNQISNLVFDQVKHSLLEELKNDLRKEINAQLEAIPEGFINPNSASILDDVLAQASYHMKENGVEPLVLPDHIETFQRQLLFFTTHGELRLSSGILHGLSTLRRTGDVMMVYEHDAVVLEANLGFENLTGGYDWNAHVVGVGPAGHAAITVRSISAHIQIRQELRSGSKPQIESFKVTNIRQIWIDISGLGTWDFIFEIIVNLVTNSLKLSLANAIAGPVEATVQNELNSMTIPLI